MIDWKAMRAVLFVPLAALCIPGCGADGPPLQPGVVSHVYEVSGRWPAGFSHFLEACPARSDWSWRSARRDSLRPPASARLETDGTGYTWRLEESGRSASDLAVSGLLLTPADSVRWHEMRTDPADSVSGWLPLPRRAVESAHYLDLLHLMSALAPGSFENRVRHWQVRPIPVDPGQSRSGAVDLTGELIRAGEIWNAAYGEELFRIPEPGACGIRMVHLPGRILRPPCYIRFVRTDSLGGPKHLQITIGDTWDDPWDVPHARRALLHELAHALMLWGHSRDRRHLLWYCGTIVDGPSRDEIECVRLWRALPAGFDFGRYGSRGELDP